MSTPDPIRAMVSGAPAAADPADITVLTDALTAAGVTIGADDGAAVQWIAGADTAIVATVGQDSPCSCIILACWLRIGKYLPTRHNYTLS